MKKKFFKFVLFLMLGFSIIAIAGCNNASSGDIATPYTFTNRSSYTVTMWDSTASITLEPGEQVKAWFNETNSIHDVRYAPADKVKVVGSGLVYEFVDK